MTDQSFPKSHRLLDRRQFDAVFQQKCSAADGRVIVYAAQNDLGHPRLGIVVSKKIGNSVARNRWKRLLREAFRLSKEDLPKSKDYVVLPRSEVEPTLDAVRRSLVQVARRAAGKLKRQARRGSD